MRKCVEFDEALGKVLQLFFQYTNSLYAYFISLTPRLASEQIHKHKVIRLNAL